MSQEKDEGFIQMYVKQFAQLQVRNERGEDISADLDALVEKTKSHSKLVEGESGVDNLPGIVGRLKVMSHSASLPETSFPDKFADGSAQRRADFFAAGAKALGG